MPAVSAFGLDMADGRLDGLSVMGQNPAVGGPNAALERKALGTLKWLVVRDLVLTETAKKGKPVQLRPVALAKHHAVAVIAGEGRERAGPLAKVGQRRIRGAGASA